MPGLVPGIHVLATSEDVDGRDKPGHDGTSDIPVLVLGLGGCGDYKRANRNVDFPY
jgi:hypothetical protein